MTLASTTAPTPDGPPLPPLSLGANVRWTLGGNAVYAACQWGMLVAIAKLGSPEMVGGFSLALAISAPVVMFTNLQLAQIQATDTGRCHRFGDYLGLRLAMCPVALAAIVAIAFAADRAPPGGGARGGAVIVIALVGLAKVVESISDVCYGLFQQRERMDLCTRSLLLRGPLSLLGLYLGLLTVGSLGAGVLALALVWLAVALAYDLPAAKRVLGEPGPPSNISRAPRARIDLATMARLFKLAFPMGFVTLLWTLDLTVPRYYIESYLGERELGFFSAMAYTVVSGTLVVHALGRSASPTLARHFALGDRAAFLALLLKLMGWAAAIGGVGVFVVALAGPEVLRILYRPEYAAHAGAFLAIMVAGALGYVTEILVYGLTAARLFKTQLPLFAIALGVITLGCAVLVPRHGLMGAVEATAASFLLCSAGAAAILIRALRGLEAVES
ncbi:MAG: lipopolysaccharide biosynthesis protein [Thermoanaerobaculia bacterium]|nr:lipopolysaccharide biosynthesis protein [Thermoanaerobaculia bacterium]